MATVNLCKCNNCNTVLVDQNPQVKAKQYEIPENAVEMQWTGGLSENEQIAAGLDTKDPHWVCPVCLTDSYLVDL